MGVRERTFKGTAAIRPEDAPRLVLRANGKTVWLCLYEGSRFVGSLDSTYELRRLGASIQEALSGGRKEAL